MALRRAVPHATALVSTLYVAAASIGCSRSAAEHAHETSTRPAVARVDLTAAPPPANASGVASIEVPSLQTGEAVRTRIGTFESEPLLRPQGAILREHFGAAPKGPFELQRIELASGATALLLSRNDETDPLVLVVDRDVLLWSKGHPTSGMVPPVEHLAVVPRADGGVVLFGWVTPLRTLAARMWAGDGNAFGDFEVFTADGCDSVSAARAPPGQGWVVACASARGTRAQRLREDGTAAWGAGTLVGSGNAAGPATIAFDATSSWLLVERAAAIGGDRLLAFRYDLTDGAGLWAQPADLGVVRWARSSPARAVASTLREGLVRVAAPLGTAGSGALQIRSDGTLVR